MTEMQVTGHEALFPRYPGWCSFCRRNPKDVGPLAEGPDQVYICHQCCMACAKLIQAECQRLGIPGPPGQQESKL
jgi:hypothetical protein